MDYLNTNSVNQLLVIIDNSTGKMLYTDILNKSPLPAVTTAKLIKEMLKEGLLFGKFGAYERIGITPLGMVQLQAYRDKLAEEAEECRKFEEQARKKAAEETANKKSDRRFNLFITVLGAVAGSVITLFVEHILLK